MLLAALVLRAHADVHRPLDLDQHAGQAEAALLHRLALVARPLEPRVDERGDRAVGLDAVDEHAVHQADLRRGEPDAERVVHQLRPCAAPASRSASSKLLDRERAAAQHRVAVLAHEPQRGVAPRAGLGVERGVLGLGDLGGLLVVARHRRRF